MTTKSKKAKPEGKVKKKKVKPIITVDPDEFTYDDDISEMGEIDFDSVVGMIEEIDDIPLYPKILIFGEQGTGKTTFLGTLPRPLLVLDCNERGTMSIRGKGHKRIKVRNHQDLENIYWYLATQKHPFKSLAIDTTTQMADIVMAHVLREDGHEGIPHKGHWGGSTQLQKTLLIRFRNLPMPVAFAAQLKRLNEDDLEDDEKNKVPMMSPAVRAILGAAVDVIGYTYIKEVDSTVKGKLVTKYSYRMRIGPSSEILTKVRTIKEVKYPAVLEDPTFDRVFKILQKTLKED